MNLFPLNYYQLSSGSIMSERFSGTISLRPERKNLLFWVYSIVRIARESHSFSLPFSFHFTQTNCRLSLTWKGYKWINKKELFGFEMPENIANVRIFHGIFHVTQINFTFVLLPPSRSLACLSNFPFQHLLIEEKKYTQTFCCCCCMWYSIRFSVVVVVGNLVCFWRVLRSILLNEKNLHSIACAAFHQCHKSSDMK